MLFPVGEIAQELTRSIVLEGLKGEVDLGVQISGSTDVVLKGVKVTCSKCHDRKEVVRFEDNLVVVIIGIRDNGKGDVEERVSLSVKCTWFMSKREIKLAKIEWLASLAMSKVLSCISILKVAVIWNNIKQLREAFKIVPPVLKSANDGKHLFVIDLIVMLHIHHWLGAISYRVPEIVIEFLKEDATYDIAEGIDFDMCGVMGFPHGKNRFIGELVLEALEG